MDSRPDAPAPKKRSHKRKEPAVPEAATPLPQAPPPTPRLPVGEFPPATKKPKGPYLTKNKLEALEERLAQQEQKNADLYHRVFRLEEKPRDQDKPSFKFTSPEETAKEAASLLLKVAGAGSRWVKLGDRKIYVCWSNLADICGE